MNFAFLMSALSITCSFYYGHIGNEQQATALALLANVWAAAHWVNAQRNT